MVHKMLTEKVRLEGENTLKPSFRLKFLRTSIFCVYRASVTTGVQECIRAMKRTIPPSNFEVTFANRPDVQSGPKRYFRHLQPALNYTAFLAGERKHVCIFEREEHGGTGDKWKAFWWSKGLQKSIGSSREAEDGGYICVTKATMTTTRFISMHRSILTTARRRDRSRKLDVLRRFQ